MVARARRNDHGDCVYDEQSLIEHVYQNPSADISQFYIENTEQYLAALQELGIDLPAIQGEPQHHEKPADLDQRLQSQWHMPDNYHKINVLEYLLARCQSDTERERVKTEYELFQKKKFYQGAAIFDLFRGHPQGQQRGLGRGQRQLCGQLLFVFDRRTQDKSTAVQFGSP